MKKTIELTENEANALIAIIDVANKAEGLKLAGNCIHFATLLQNAFKTEPAKEETTVAE
jgi:hypothetical protein